MSLKFHDISRFSREVVTLMNAFKRLLHIVVRVVFPSVLWHCCLGVREGNTYSKEYPLEQMAEKNEWEPGDPRSPEKDGRYNRGGSGW